MPARPVEQRPPAGDRERIGPPELEVAAGEMEAGKRLSDRAAMPDGDALGRQAVQESGDGGGLAGVWAGILIARKLFYNE